MDVEEPQFDPELVVFLLLYSLGMDVEDQSLYSYTTLYIGGAPCSVLRANELMTGLLIMGCTTISER